MTLTEACRIVGEYPNALYLAFPRLLDDENLVEVYSEENKDDK